MIEVLVRHHATNHATAKSNMAAIGHYEHLTFSVMCIWRGHEGRADYPASLEGPWRTLYVVGATRNAGAVAEFELLFHEIGSITNLLNSLTTNQSMKHTGRTD